MCSSVEGDAGEDESILQRRKEMAKRLQSVDSLLSEAAHYLPTSRVQVYIFTKLHDAGAVAQSQRTDHHLFGV